MKRSWRRALICLFALSLGLVAASEIWPNRVAKILLAGLNFSAGLQSKSVETSFGKVHYLEGGKGEVVVFIHGIFALKEHWIDVSREISGDYRVLLLDLPGFGENRRLDPREYDYAQQTENLLETLNSLEVEHFHIVANSMGAQIAGLLASSFPERVQSIAFIGGPVGVKSTRPSDMDRAIMQGQAPLVVTTYAEYDARMEWLFPEEPFIPRPIARYWARNEVSHAKTNPKIWNSVLDSSVTPLGKLASNISQPALVLWCRGDQIFHISGAMVLANALPSGTLEIVSGCGHLPMLDSPHQTGVALLEFLSKQK